MAALASLTLPVCGWCDRVCLCVQIMAHRMEDLLDKLKRQKQQAGVHAPASSSIPPTITPTTTSSFSATPQRSAMHRNHTKPSNSASHKKK